MLDEVTRLDPGLCARLSIILVESSPYLRRLQERMLEANSKTAKIIWASNLGVLDDDSLVGMVLSNELVDAFPVNRVRMTSEGLKEIYVNHVGGQFVEQLEAPSTDELSNSLKALDVDLPVGFTTEINLNAVDWMQQVARVLRRGVGVTIDYGHTSSDYVSPMRKDGTLFFFFFFFFLAIGGSSPGTTYVLSGPMGLVERGVAGF